VEQNNLDHLNQPQHSGDSKQQQGQNKSHGNYQSPYQGEKLPGDPSAITLGIASLVLLLIGCLCLGVPAIITLILSIIGLVIANNNLKIYHTDPTKYSQNSLKSITIGRILNILGIGLSGLVCLIFLVIVIFFGSILAAALDGEFNAFESFENQQQESIFNHEETTSEEDWKYYDEEELDSLKTETDPLIK
jgi:hypothetical protein